MAWEDLSSEVAAMFGALEVPEALTRDSRHVPRLMHVERQRHKPWSHLAPEERRRQYERQRRLRSVVRAEKEALAPTTCQRPGCCNPIRRGLRPGKVPSTCSHACSNALSDYRRRGVPTAILERVCACCGRPFLPRTPSHRQRFCSAPCRKRAHRQLSGRQDDNSTPG